MTGGGVAKATRRKEMTDERRRAEEREGDLTRRGEEEAEKQERIGVRKERVEGEEEKQECRM